MKHIKTLIFDLDDTLYPHSLGYKEHSYQRIPEFCQKYLNLSFEEYAALSKEYFAKYGNAYKLYQDKGTSFEEYIKYVCDLDMSKVKYNKELDEKIKTLPHKKIIYTDANLTHTIDTLKQLKLDKHFKDIHTIVEANYIFKSHSKAFENFLKIYNLKAEETAIFEDNLENLKSAKASGLTTILINEQGGEKPDFCDFMFSYINSALSLFL